MALWLIRRRGRRLQGGLVVWGGTPSAEGAVPRLRQRFLSWQGAQPRLLEDVQETPRLSDAAVRAEQLGELAQVGLSALTYLQSRTAPPAGWLTQQMSIIDAAEKPS